MLLVKYDHPRGHYGRCLAFLFVCEAALLLRLGPRRPGRHLLVIQLRLKHHLMLISIKLKLELHRLVDPPGHYLP
jgi:hypothetical protein